MDGNESSPEALSAGLSNVRSTFLIIPVKCGWTSSVGLWFRASRVNRSHSSDATVLVLGRNTGGGLLGFGVGRHQSQCGMRRGYGGEFVPCGLRQRAFARTTGDGPCVMRR